MNAARPLKDLLNPPQLEAATIPSGPVCIVAGAGSGKTRVITHRLAYLVKEGICAPEQCMAVTFTKRRRVTWVGPEFAPCVVPPGHR